MANIEAVDRSAWSALEIGLPVDEIEPMRRFYCEGLGFEPAGHVNLPKVHVEAFRFGDCLLKLSLFLDPGRRPKPRDPNEATFYITLRVSDLERSLSSCLAIGAGLLLPVTSAQTEDLRPIRFAFVADPMGNRIELVQGNAWSED